MLQQPGLVFKVSYRRQGWRAGRVKSVALLSKRGALGFADKLTRTKGTTPLAELRIDVMAGVWIELDDDEMRTPVRRKRRAADPYAVDLSKTTFEGDDDED